MEPLVPTPSAAVHEAQHFGYSQKLKRHFSWFTSFTSTIAFLSVTTGVATSFGFMLRNSGPLGIWFWFVVFAGQGFVALVFSAMAAKIPLSGFSYQWPTRLLHPVAGVFVGWISYAYLVIVVVSVDLAMVKVALDPLFGITIGNQALFSVGIQDVTVDDCIAFAVVVFQALLLIGSTKLVSWMATVAAIIDLAGVMAVIVACFVFLGLGEGSSATLFSTGIVDPSGCVDSNNCSVASQSISSVISRYWNWMGPAMAAILLGSYSFVGFETATNIAEETRQARQAVPRAIVRIYTVHSSSYHSSLRVVAPAVAFCSPLAACASFALTWF